MKPRPSTPASKRQRFIVRFLDGISSITSAATLSRVGWYIKGSGVLPEGAPVEWLIEVDEGLEYAADVVLSRLEPVEDYWQEPQDRLWQHKPLPVKPLPEPVITEEAP